MPSRHRGPAWSEDQVNEQAVLYALSTLAQTCAALAALVGALGLYRAQSLRTEQTQTEASIRRLLVAHGGTMAGDAQLMSTEWITNQARQIVHAHPEQGELIAAIAKWDRYEPDFRRSTRLLVRFGGWNLLVILLSLGGFAVVPALTDHLWASVLLWGLAIGTVLSTGAMILEANNALAGWFELVGLGRVVRSLER